MASRPFDVLETPKKSRYAKNEEEYREGGVQPAHLADGAEVKRKIQHCRRKQELSTTTAPTATSIVHPGYPAAPAGYNFALARHLHRTAHHIFPLLGLGEWRQRPRGKKRERAALTRPRLGRPGVNTQNSKIERKRNRNASMRMFLPPSIFALFSQDRHPYRAGTTTRPRPGRVCDRFNSRNGPVL